MKVLRMLTILMLVVRTTTTIGQHWQDLPDFNNLTPFTSDQLRYFWRESALKIVEDHTVEGYRTVYYFNEKGQLLWEKDFKRKKKYPVRVAEYKYDSGGRTISKRECFGDVCECDSMAYNTGGQLVFYSKVKTNLSGFLRKKQVRAVYFNFRLWGADSSYTVLGDSMLLEYEGEPAAVVLCKCRFNRNNELSTCGCDNWSDSVHIIETPDGVIRQHYSKEAPDTAFWISQKDFYNKGIKRRVEYYYSHARIPYRTVVYNYDENVNLIRIDDGLYSTVYFRYNSQDLLTEKIKVDNNSKLQFSKFTYFNKW